MLQSPPSNLGVGCNPLLGPNPHLPPVSTMLHGYHPPHPEFLAAAAAASAAGAPGGQPPNPFLPHQSMPHSTLMEPPKPRFMFRVPRVVPNQKQKFESDDLLKRHSREAEVRYTPFRDRPVLERQAKFIQSLREGHTEIAFIPTGFNLVLSFNPHPSFDPQVPRQLDFEKEPGKVQVQSSFILNGVCVRWKGFLHLERLDGVGCLEFDEEFAKQEDIVLRDQVGVYNRRVKEIDEQRKLQQRHLAAIMGHRQAVLSAAALQHHHHQAPPMDSVLQRLASPPEALTSAGHPSPDSGAVGPRSDLNSSFLLSDILNEKSSSSSLVSSTSPLGSLEGPISSTPQNHMLGRGGSTILPSHGLPELKELQELKRAHLNASSVVSSSEVHLDVVDVCEDEDS
eukprot:maker-scaffold1211_size55490-snap-gene-0.10 protein:Tk10014 transcript:maker-scaffold1211_size55490-snap-gene-0.10-mRNA-1 annotation:"protein big brother isoform x1"